MRKKRAKSCTKKTKVFLCAKSGWIRIPDLGFRRFFNFFLIVRFFGKTAHFEDGFSSSILFARLKKHFVLCRLLFASAHFFIFYYYLYISCNFCAFQRFFLSFNFLLFQKTMKIEQIQFRKISSLKIFFQFSCD